MNLDDLTEELQHRATEAGADQPGPATLRLTGVRGRIRDRRRRRALAAAGLATVAVVGIILVPGVSGLRADRTETPAITGTPTPTSTRAQTTQASDPLRFAADAAGDPLLGSVIGRPGQAEVVLRFTPSDSNVMLSEFCRLAEAASGVTILTTVNGHPYLGSDCSRDDAAAAGQSLVDEGPAANRAFWAGLGVTAGQESVVRVKVQSKNAGSPVPPTVRIGVGVYDLSGPRVQSQGLSLKQQLVVDDQRYRLETYRTAKVTAADRKLSIKVEAGTDLGLVLAGNLNDDTAADPFGVAHLVVDGEERQGMEGGGTATEPLDDTEAHTLEVRLDPGLTGTMVIAYYVQVG